MTVRKKKIFNWNHISNKLTLEQIDELKSYYRVYHRKCWAYKQAVKRFKKLKLLGNSASVVFASGGIASAVVSGGIALVGISTVAVLLQGWMAHQNLDLKIQNCTYAHQSYQHLLNSMKDMLRAGDFRESIYLTMNNVDDVVTDLSPIVDRFYSKYDKKFTPE